jgi:hypothetical protein
MAEELAKCCTAPGPDGALRSTTPALWEWLERIYKLRDQIEVCRSR